MASENGSDSSRSGGGAGRLRIATTGDIHCRDSNRDAVVASFAALDDDIDGEKLGPRIRQLDPRPTASG